jgi:hypothetical protein
LYPPRTPRTLSLLLPLLLPLLLLVLVVLMVLVLVLLWLPPPLLLLPLLLPAWLCAGLCWSPLPSRVRLGLRCAHSRSFGLIWAHLSVSNTSLVHIIIKKLTFMISYQPGKEQLFSF